MLDERLARRLTTLTQPQQSYVLGMLGASLLRDWHEGGKDQSDRLSALFAAVDVLRGASSGADDRPVEVDVQPGYSEWAGTYDQINSMLRAEESSVRSLLAPRLRPGAVVLDAACGTGRHAAWLTASGYRAIGVDITAAMLRRAASAAPRASLVQGDILALPLTSGAVDAAVCSLALCHVPELAPALAEIARVLRPGGALLVSDPHGRAAYAGGQGFYGSGGVARPRFVRNHYRQASEWIQAFNHSGFLVESCDEPRMDTASAVAHPVAEFFPAATSAALCGVPYLWVWSVTKRDD